MDAQRVAVLEAAIALLAEQGYAGCSMAAVASRAGIATGSVYRHFPSKAELVAELFWTVVSRPGMPRLYREAPLPSIWEGSGNVAALDSLRAMARQPETVDAYVTEVERAWGVDPRLDQAIARVRKELGDLEDIQYRAHRVVELMALTLQGSLLHRHGDPAVADAFCASRLDRDWGGAFGTLPSGVDTRAVLARVSPDE